MRDQHVFSCQEPTVNVLGFAGQEVTLGARLIQRGSADLIILLTKFKILFMELTFGFHKIFHVTRYFSSFNFAFNHLKLLTCEPDKNTQGAAFDSEALFFQPLT